MTAAANDESDWVGISRPGGQSRVIGELTMRPAAARRDVANHVRASRARMINQPELAKYVADSDGELAALDWSLGRRDTSPLTDQIGVDVTDPSNLDRERSVATDMLQRQVEMDHRGSGYVSGVESTLMWILNQTELAPD